MSEPGPGELWHVSGRVQGVGFRWFVVEAAQRLAVCGDVRNLDDGRVEVRARGSVAALEALLGDIRRGPRGARVEGVQRQALAEPLTGEGFRIR